MRIAVLGAMGQLGRDLIPRLSGDVVPLTRAQIDLAKPETIATTVDSVKADVLVNCAAYNFVDKAETDAASAFAVNAIGVRDLARACATHGTRLVQISTDFVFGLDTTRTMPLTETSPTGPVSTYGVSKLTGEQFTLAAHPDHLVVRTCGLYGVWGSGGKGGNFVETMLRLASQGKPIRVVNDQQCSPTYTADLANALVALIAKQASGIVHVTNDGGPTWHEFASEIFRLSNMPIAVEAITSEQFNAPAKRPTYSVLSTDRLVTMGIARPRIWQEAMGAYLDERKKRQA